jgi:hypothetical protein
MAEIFSTINPLSNLTGLAKPDGSFKLYSEQLSSINFDGVATKKQTKTKISDLKPGQTVMVSDASYSSTSAFITKIESRDGFINDDPEQPVKKYYVYHVSEFSMEQPFTYNATYGDSYSANAELYVVRDDVENFVIGNDGWALTNNGNAIFSNVFARGRIEATSGRIDGNLDVGTNQIGQPLVQIGADLFNGSSFESITEKHSGILLDVNNYLLSYPSIVPIEISSVVVTNSTVAGYLYSATFTLPLVSGEVNTLQVGDFVKLSGFTDPRTTALNTTHQVRSVGTNTFTIAVSYDIAMTSPVTINVSATSFALNKTYNLTTMTLSSVSDNIDVSTVKIYLDDSDFFSVGSEITLESFLGELLSLNGRFRIEDQGVGYISISSKRITAGTYTSSLGSIIIYSKVHKFKVGDNFNYLSFSSETGSLKLTGTINAHSGNFINQVYVGQAATTFYIFRKKLLDNFATLSTTQPHSFSVGDIITVVGVDSTFDGTYTITQTPSQFSFKYAKTAANVTEVDLVEFGYASSDSSVDGTIKVGVADTGISIDGTNDPATSAIYAGEGEYGNANTGFWMDASGRFSLKDKLLFTDTGNLTVSGTVNASAGNFTNTVYIGTSVTPGTLQVGRGDNYFQITGTNVDTTTAIKTNGASFGGTGVWLDASGRFSLGDQLVFEDGNLIVSGVATDSLIVGSSPNQVIMSDTAVSGAAGIKVTSSGDYIAASGDFSLGNGGVIWDESEGELRVNGILKGYIAAELTPVTFNPGTMNFGYFSSAGTAPGGVGLKLDEFNYWFVGDKFKVGGSSNFVKWDGSDLSVVGNITATTGNIAGWQINPNRFENSGIGLVAPVIATRVNQISNPSFESSAGYWWLTIGGVNQPLTRTYDENATPVIDSSTDPDTYAGNIYLNVKAPTGVSGNAILYHTGIKDPQNAVGTGFSRPKITAGQPYTFSIYVRSQVSRNVTVGIQWYTDTDTILSTANSTVDITTVGSWKRFKVTGTAPTGTSSAVAFLKIDGMLAGEEHKVDAALLEKTSELRQYFDGDSDLSIWINNNQVSGVKEGESRYGEVAIYTGTDFDDRSSSPFYVSYNGFVNIENGNLSSFNLTSNSIFHDQSSDVFTRYIEFATDTSLATVPRIAVVSYEPELNYTTSSTSVPTYSAGQIRYEIDQHTLKIGDLVTISGFANINYNVSNATIVNTTDKEIFINSLTNPGTATGTGNILVLEAAKFSAQWASDHTAFYASTDGSVSIGSALSYDSEAGLSVTGEVQGYQGWIGGENGWNFDSSGILYSGSGNNFFAFPSQNAKYSSAPIPLNVTRALADDQWEEFNQLFSNYYAEVNISSLSATYKNDPFVSLKNISFNFNYTTTTGIDTLLDDKTLSTQAVYDTRAFFYQAAVKYYRIGASYSSGSTTVQFPVSGTGGGDMVYIQNIGGGTPGYNATLGATVSGPGIQAGTTVTQVDSVNARITLSKPTTSLASEVSLNFEKTNSTLKGATSLPVYAVKRDQGVTKLFFKEAKFSSTLLNSLNANYRLSTTDAATSSVKIRAIGSSTLINSLNNQTLAISSLGSDWEEIGSEYLWSLSFNQAGQPDIPFSYAEKSIFQISIPLPTDTYTFVFYPEAAGVYIHDQNPVPEGGRTYTTNQHTLSFYDTSITATDTYYMWGGSTNPSSAPLSISKNIATGKFLIKADAGTTPVGSIVMWSEPTLPTGWILCNGQSTTAYPLLSAVVGANVPNLVDRFIVGAGSAYGLKSVGGGANHSHGDNFGFSGGDHSHGNTASSSATGGSHNHSDNISVNAHNHSSNFSASANNTAGRKVASGNTSNTLQDVGHTHGVSGSVSTNNATNQGGNISGSVSNSASHEHVITTTMTNNNSNVGTLTKSGSVTDGSTLPPYYALYFIIYTGKIT